MIKNGRALRILISVSLSVGLTAVIFFFSNQDGNSSSELSGKILDFLLGLFNIKPDAAWHSQLHHLLRKLAHLSVFGVLGALYYASYQFALPKMAWLPAIGTAFLYACVDEYHQSFVAGRGAALRDVIIDTTGAAIFIVTVLLIRYAFTASDRPLPQRGKAS
ncbi:MAG: VanZ family protein [Eubacteriales bacterium]|nr:VanZ family protein [Eubacteriales bacterium]MDD3882925.1 VanZ family protein [Eubacteriales bacterium]MDD4513528.1 VanZ family protein [Eubacteriales bacterium]